MKKLLAVGLAGLMLAMVGCSGNNNAPASGANSTTAPESSFKANEDITVISREDGSGTRSAFVELMGILQDGKDKTTKEAIIANKTDVVMTGVANNAHAIGYISLGSVNDTIKSISVDGVTASVDNVKNGSYKVSRPFILATKGEQNPLTKDFLAFIMSAEGQQVVGKSYISVTEGEAYTPAALEGRLVVAGSTSVTPIIEKLAEAYKVHNPKVVIEVQGTGSSAGMTAAIDGTCDIGMSSRDLKDSEKAELDALTIALDGIAVIVNKENPNTNLTSENIKNIFTGEVLSWDEVQ